MQCVILAGGLGTRMRPFTDERPKALIPVGGSPFAALQLSLLAKQGVTDVVYAIGHLGDQIVDFVGDGSRWNVSVRYSRETGELLGTGGALRLALDDGLLDDCFFVLYGDSYLPVDFAAVHQTFLAAGLPALMTVVENCDQWDGSNAVYADGRVTLYDKRRTARESPMRFIDYGLSVLTSGVVADLVPPGRPLDLSDVFHQLSVTGRLAGYLTDRRFYEVGSPQGLEDLELLLKADTSMNLETRPETRAT